MNTINIKFLKIILFNFFSQMCFSSVWQIMSNLKFEVERFNINWAKAITKYGFIR